MDFLFQKNLWYCISVRVKQEFVFIEWVGKGWITTVKDLECFHGGIVVQLSKSKIDGGNSTFVNSFDKTNFFVVL